MFFWKISETKKFILKLTDLYRVSVTNSRPLAWNNHNKDSYKFRTKSKKNGHCASSALLAPADVVLFPLALFKIDPRLWLWWFFRENILWWSFDKIFHCLIFVTAGKGSLENWLKLKSHQIQTLSLIFHFETVFNF